MERAVAEGESLVIFDNLVLDLEKSFIPLINYVKVHPGGKFVLMKNFGRDISKFFYGGYSLVNPGMATYAHSLSALRIAESLVVGVLEDQSLVTDVPMTLISKTEVNNTSSTFIFTQKDGNVVSNFKKWYFDVGMFGRHFIVYSETDPKTKRQYTICNTMQPDLLDALRKLGEASPLPVN